MRLFLSDAFLFFSSRVVSINDYPFFFAQTRARSAVIRVFPHFDRREFLFPLGTKRGFYSQALFCFFFSLNVALSFMDDVGRSLSQVRWFGSFCPLLLLRDLE